ncbi:uncharacterized protein LOC141715038 [Apium graveolens]|uniref:uncharacterized protein LOC141715038 n=1 Tax=Apium graveolens TaxID=4045 RepID=UPI003D78C096
MIELLAEFDPIMQEHTSRILQGETHYHYLSHKIQNEMIQLLAQEVKGLIIDRVKDAKYFSFKLNCTSDASNDEQMSLVLRCVNVSESPIRVQEFFIDFLKVYDTSGLGLYNKLVEALNVHGFDIDNIRGQGYDNGSDMKGKNKVYHVSKLLQSEDMQIDIAIRELKGLPSFLQNYREVGFQDAMVEATEIANKMEVELIFVEKCVVHRKRQFDESTGEDVTQSAEENFKNNYFLYIIDQAISLFSTSFEENFGILWNFEKLKAIEPEKLRTFCNNLVNITIYGENSDLNGDDLYEDLCMVCRNLPEGINSVIDVLTYIKEMEGSYPNAWIAYRILLTIPVIVAYAK